MLQIAKRLVVLGKGINLLEQFSSAVAWLLNLAQPIYFSMNVGSQVVSCCYSVFPQFMQHLH